MRFDVVLRRDLFHYYPDTFPQLAARPVLPLGVLAQTERLTLDALLEGSVGPDMRTLAAGHRAGVVTLTGITRANLTSLQDLPSLQRVSYSDGKSTVLPKEVATLPRLRVLELNLTRKFKTLHKNLALASGLEALLLVNLHNLTDISLLGGLSSLRCVSFSNTIKLRDYSPLQELPQLRHLELKSLDLERAASVVQALTNLTTLDLGSSAFYRSTFPALASIIESLPSLTTLGLASSVLDHGTLPSLDHLAHLNLNQVERFSAGMFSRARRLRTLSMQFYAAASLPADLGALASLEALDLSFAKALHDDTDFSPLAELSGLQYLDLSQQRVLTRLPQAVASLQQLRQINLAGHRITEISALRGLPALRCADLAGVKDEAHLVDVVMSLPALERVNVASHIDILKLAAHPTLKLIVGPRADPDAVAGRFDVRHSAAFLRR